MEHCKWLCCGVLRKEIQFLHEQGKIRGTLKFLDSMLHMNPDHLESTLEKILKKKEWAKTVLVYGDCCPKMHIFTQTGKVQRVDFINCAQLLLGKSRYRELMLEQAFLLVPEWADRWQEVFAIELGLDKDIATELMQDNRKVIVFLNTSLVPVPEQEISKFSEYVGLPYRIENVGFDSLQNGLLKAQEQLEKNSGELWQNNEC